MDPVIDVLMATYNGQKYVEQQIESILNQTYTSIRLIIRDDGSTDNTSQILKEYAEKYPEKILLLPTDKNLGIRGNFSKLMESATAPYAMLSDQDDVWDNDKAVLTLAKMQEIESRVGKNTPVLIHTDLRVVDEQLKLMHPSFWRYTKLYPQKGRTLNRLLLQNVITGCTVMINLPLRAKALPVPQESIMHDWWLGLVASSFGEIGYIEKATMSYRQHGKNCVGAQKFNILSGVKKLLNITQDQVAKLAYLKKNQLQVQTFKERYTHCLSPNQLDLLNAYFKLLESTSVKHLYLSLKHRFFRQGWIRNTGTLIFKLFYPFRISS